MVFKRRDKLSIPTRAFRALVPLGGWRRALEYLGHRMRRLPDTPHRIALGCACGVFASFTPLFGLHFILALVLARLVGGNGLAALIGTAAGNPLTFPLIASVALGLGRRIVGHGATGRDYGRVTDAFRQFFEGLWESVLSLFGHGTAQWHKLGAFVHDVWWPYLVGGLLPGLVAAIASYYLARPLIAAYQTRRRSRTAARIARHKARADARRRKGYVSGEDGAAG